MDDLRDDYRRAGLGQKFGLGKRPALILIDFVEAYFSPASPLYTDAALQVMRAALTSALRLRFAAQKAGIPVILTKVELAPTELAANLMFRRTAGTGLFEKGSPLASLAAGLDPEPGEILLNKHYASAFFATPLASMLANLKADSLIITGLSTSGCVRATAVDCVSHGFIPIVAREAVADRDPRPHEASLFDIEGKYGDVLYEKELQLHLYSIGSAPLD